MKKLLASSLLVMLLAGCAVTPFQRFSAAIDSGQPLPVAQVLIDASNTTIAWADGPDGPKTDLGRLGEKLSTNWILAALPEQREDLELIRAKAAIIKGFVTGAGDGKFEPQILLLATQMKYGNKDDNLDALKTRAFNRFMTGVDVCSNVIPKQQFIGLAAKYFGL